MSYNFTAKVNRIQNPRGSVVAFATLIIDGVIAINGFRVINGRNGAFVSAPQKKGSKPDENGKDVYYDEVRFLEEKEEGKFKGPIAQAAFDAILNEFNGGASDNRSSNGDSVQGHGGDRPTPNNNRPRVSRW